MLSEDVRSLIEQGLLIVARDKGVSQLEAEERASSLLIISAELLKQKYHLENKVVKSSSIQRVSYSKSIHEAEGKNITEKKVLAESNPAYIKHREEAEELDNDISYLKAIIEVFKDAHIMWRQISKPER